MISSNELRIGNLVLDPYGNEREVTGVHGNYVRLGGISFNDSNYPASELSPVPLTSEVRKRLDREVLQGEYDIERGLHWLQNEYYFNTGGVELKIKSN